MRGGILSKAFAAAIWCVLAVGCSEGDGRPETPVEPPPSHLPEAVVLDKPPRLRVWLRDAAESPIVESTGPCAIMPRVGGARPLSLAKLPPAQARLSETEIQLGSRDFECDALDLVPGDGVIFKLDDVQYSGTLQLYRAGDGLAVINMIDMETYLACVVAAEMPAGWPAEALKAQAVAARSYALHTRQVRLGKRWHLMNTAADQVYRGGPVAPRALDAVRQTRGEVLTRQNGLFPAFYHSTCGGRTWSPEEALNRKGYGFMEGTRCTDCSDSPYYRWSAEAEAAELIEALNAIGKEVRPPLKAVAAASDRPPAKRTVSISGADRGVEVRVSDLRSMLGPDRVLSERFTCRVENGAILIEGRGLGHGVGLCQYGARGKAKNGWDYRRILRAYYQSTELKTLY